MLENPLIINLQDPLRNQGGRIKTKNQTKVHHYDVVDFDVLTYWGQYRSWVSGEPLRIVRCVARYSKDNREVSLLSFPSQLYSISDNLTRDRAKYCQVVGNLFEDEDLLTELRQAERGEVDPITMLRYVFQVKRLQARYAIHDERYRLAIVCKDLHALRERTYEALDLYLAATGGPFVNRQQLYFTLL